MHHAVTVILDVSACLWLTLGALVALGAAKRSLYSDRFLRYYLVCTGALIVLAVLLRYVRMED